MQSFCSTTATIYFIWKRCVKSWGNHLSEISSGVIIYSICRQHHKHDFLIEFHHEYIFNAPLGPFAFSSQNIVLQFWMPVPNKAAIFEKSTFSNWYYLYYLFRVRTLTHCFGVMLHRQIQALNQDPQILCCTLYETNTHKAISQDRTSQFERSFSLPSLFRSNTITQFSLLQRSVTSKKVQQNRKSFLCE